MSTRRAILLLLQLTACNAAPPPPVRADVPQPKPEPPAVEQRLQEQPTPADEPPPKVCADSPNHEWSVCVEPRGCEDFCHHEVFLVSNGSSRLLGPGVDTVILSWSPKANQLAVELHGLVVLDLDTGERWEHPGLQAPSFAPDGRLFARSDDGDYFVVDHDSRKLAFRISNKSKRNLKADLEYAYLNGGTGEFLSPARFGKSAQPEFERYPGRASAALQATFVELTPKHWWGH